MIFFFKQKTAYEIKECDWSSDVCSSDLQKPNRTLLRNISIIKTVKPGESYIHEIKRIQRFFAEQNY